MHPTTSLIRGYPIKPGTPLPRHKWTNRLFGLFILGGAVFALTRYAAWMDAYEIGILLLASTAFIVMGVRWRALQLLTATTASLALLALWLYGSDISSVEHSFLLKYFLASQSAIMWMGFAFWSATIVYTIGWFGRSGRTLKRGSQIAWIGVLFGVLGLLVAGTSRICSAPISGIFRSRISTKSSCCFP